MQRNENKLSTQFKWSLLFLAKLRRKKITSFQVNIIAETES